MKREARRDDALTHERIVAAAIALLDTDGEDGLTFRALAAALATGAGAIYWHVANKDELLVAATDVVVAGAIADDARAATPQAAIRAVALGVFDAIDAHPWVGTQLARAPWRSATLDLFERIGRPVQALGARPAGAFTAATALVNYIVGVGSQNAANAATAATAANAATARTSSARPAGSDRAAFLAAMATAWTALDARRYAFTRAMARSLRDHDDRAEFLAGIDLIVAGITAPRPLRATSKRRPRTTARRRA